MKYLMYIFLTISLLTSLDIFLPTDYFSYRHWEKFYISTLLPGTFIPNKEVEGLEYKDRYKSFSKREREYARSKIYTQWKTDSLGFRNDSLKSNLFNSKTLFVGDSNFAGSSFDQSKIVSELYMQKTNIKAYTIAYNFRYVLTLIENDKLKNINHIILQGKPGYFDGQYREITPYYVNDKCEIKSILYENNLLQLQSNYTYFNHLKNNYKTKPFSKYIRSLFGVYNLPQHKDLEKRIKKKVNCSEFKNKFTDFDYDTINYSENYLSFEGNKETPIYFKNTIIYIKNYLNSKNIKFSYLLLSDSGTDPEFKKYKDDLNKSGRLVFDSYDLEPNAQIWQIGDSHWTEEAANNFVNLILN